MIGSGPGLNKAPFTGPPSSHRDSRWYRSAATKASMATSDGLPEGSGSDDVAWVSFSHLVAGIALYAGLGWLVGSWLGNRTLFVAVGVLIGTAFALYLVFARLGAKRSGPETPRQGRP